MNDRKAIAADTAVAVSVATRFGSFCAVGDEAVRFLKTDVYPHLDSNGTIALDFAGVRNMNSSFSNALFGNLVRRYGRSIVTKVIVRNAASNLRSEIKSSLALGAAPYAGGPASALAAHSALAT